MSKQLILITADFNCGHCTKAKKEVPPICEEKGWEFIEMQNSKIIPAKDPDNECPTGV